eukprot:CAMPEP_0174288048 /NCGR_PEP_ID=MMETSP0809-20121228/18870_1 /TAXON_ID=73025 ORGANISM="Eutreptiella gymnastica-like, Strain CCMP1594" /NCGR_SAMPLE_ID=MMETSP0809 /ASSEMBLY_ACC=CAM_ASM_000658 /LENGTH=34 /DNA_ID= /DNA_START= /DNA_END= /DNA_ORIENTATION=
MRDRQQAPAAPHVSVNKMHHPITGNLSEHLASAA